VCKTNVVGLTDVYRVPIDLISNLLPLAYGRLLKPTIVISPFQGFKNTANNHSEIVVCYQRLAIAVVPTLSKVHVH